MSEAPTIGQQIDAEISKLDTENTTQDASIAAEKADIDGLKAELAEAKSKADAAEQRLSGDEAQIANLKTQIEKAVADEADALAQMRAEIAALKAGQQPTPPAPVTGSGETDEPTPVVTGSGEATDPPPVVTPPVTLFVPINPTPDDIYTSEATVGIEWWDTQILRRNIIGTGSTPTQVLDLWLGRGADWWVQLPDTADGGKVWQDQHANGQTVILYNCAPTIIHPDQTDQQPSGGDNTPTDPPPTQSDDFTPIYPGPADPNMTIVHPGEVSVEITDQSGHTYIYSGDDPAIVDSGNRSYGSHFTHTVLQLTRPDYPLTVHFWLDTTQPRVEVQIESGSHYILDDATMPAHTLVYDAKIKVRGEIVRDYSAVKHFWGQSWFYESSRRPVVNSIASLVSQKLLPPFVRLTSGMPKLARAPRPTLLGFGGLSPYQGTTGERGELGLLTELAARAIATGDLGDLTSMFDQADCSGSWPHAFVDKTTHAPPDFVNSAFWRGRDFYAYGGRPGADKLNIYTDNSDPNGNASLSGIQIAPDHAPQISYMPFMLTGSYRHLRELQLTTNRNTASNETLVAGQVNGQVREIAWRERDLAFCEVATAHELAMTGNLINLLPVSYWQVWLKRHSDDATKIYLNGDPNGPLATYIATHAISESWEFKFWMEDYHNVLNWIAQAPVSTREAYAAIADWKLKSNIARCDPTSGWPIRHQNVSEILVVTHPDGSPIVRWDDLAVLNGIPLDGPDGDLVFDSAGWSYIGESLGCLGYGTLRGSPGCAEAYTWLKSKIPDNADLSWRHCTAPTP